MAQDFATPGRNEHVIFYANTYTLVRDINARLDRHDDPGLQRPFVIVDVMDI